MKRSKESKGVSKARPKAHLQMLRTLPNPYFEKMKQRAFVAIAEAQKRCTPELKWLFTSEERTDAKLFLNDLILSLLCTIPFLRYILEEFEKLNVLHFDYTTECESRYAVQSALGSHIAKSLKVKILLSRKR